MGTIGYFMIFLAIIVVMVEYFIINPRHGVKALLRIGPYKPDWKFYAFPLVLLTLGIILILL